MRDRDRFVTAASCAFFTWSTGRLHIKYTQQKLQGRAALLQVQQCSSHSCKHLKFHRYRV